MSNEDELKRQILGLESNCKMFQQQAKEAAANLNANKILKSAIEELKTFEYNKKIVDAVNEAIPDLKKMPDLPESVQKLMALIEPRTIYATL